MHDTIVNLATVIGIGWTNLGQGKVVYYGESGICQR